MKTLARHTGALLLLVLLTGCTSFERDWRHARLQPPAPAGSLTGPWAGTWLSEVNGHTGSLRCLVTEKSPEVYEFHFKATYWKVFRYSYLVTMPVTRTASGYTFTGNENLGFLAGGVYSYCGSVTATNLDATYSCKFDNGVFKLTR